MFWVFRKKCFFVGEIREGFMEEVVFDLGYRIYGEFYYCECGVGMILVEGLGCIKVWRWEVLGSYWGRGVIFRVVKWVFDKEILVN